MSREEDLARQLQSALASRPVIDLAKGVIMVLRRCDQDAAFAELVKVSRDHNIKVAELAECLVDHVVGWPVGHQEPCQWYPATHEAVTRTWLVGRVRHTA